MILQSISQTIAANVRRIRRRMDEAARRSGRDPASVHLVAVSKTHPSTLIREAAAAGCGEFGENYLQEALDKISELAALDATWHFIGAIQANKTRPIAEHFQWVHTVSRTRIAERLSRQCPAGKTLDVTIQVNVDADPAKAGVAPSEAASLLAAIGGLDNLRVRGLMTVLHPDSPPRAGYGRLAELFEALRSRSPRTMGYSVHGDERRLQRGHRGGCHPRTHRQRSVRPPSADLIRRIPVNDVTIAFVGAGNMARSLASGLIGAGVAAEAIRAADPEPDQRQRLEELGITTFEQNQRAVTGADAVVLAVKPQVLSRVLASLTVNAGQLLISIAAGVPVAALSALTAPGTAIVRCMPNTPALLGSGITGMFASAAVSDEQKRLADTILSAAGRTLWVDDEAKLDAVTAVSGSGPAYFFYLMEALVAAGQSLGLDADTAATLTLETAYGAARMAREGADSPARLRANVTSPGGTTERALSILDAAGTRDTIERAVAGAAARARELAEEFGRP